MATKKSNTISLESMENALFSNERISKSAAFYGFESEIPEDCCVIIEDDNDDEPSLMADTSRYLGEANAVHLVMQTAESYDKFYNISEENEDDEASQKSLWIRFCNWLKDIFKSIQMAVVSFFKRIQIWIAGDMKKHTEWFNSIGSKNIHKIQSSDVTLNINIPQVELENYNNNFNKNFMLSNIALKNIVKFESDIFHGYYGSTASVNEQKATEQNELNTLKTHLKEKCLPISLKTLKEELYGENSKSSSITAKAFFLKYKIEDLGKADKIKEKYKIFQEMIKKTTEQIKNAERTLTLFGKVPPGHRAVIMVCGKTVSHSVGLLTHSAIWYTTELIKLSNIALKFGKKAMGTSGGDSDGSSYAQTETVDRSKMNPKMAVSNVGLLN